MSALQGRLAEALSEHGFADAGLSAKEDVFGGGYEVEGEESLDDRAVDLARMRPVETVERGEATELRVFGATVEIVQFARAPLEADKLFDCFCWAETALVRAG